MTSEPDYGLSYPDADHGEAIERAYAPGSELPGGFAVMLTADR